MLKLLLDHNRCTGCRICSYACSFTKEGVMNPTMGRIHIDQSSLAVTEILACSQCGDCIEVCPENALGFDSATGAVILEQSLCSGCGFCFEACTSGYLRGHPHTGIPLLCDLCGGNPVCADICPAKAIRTGGGVDKNDQQKQR